MHYRVLLCLFVTKQTHLLASVDVMDAIAVERNSPGVELRTLDYENPSLNPVLRC